MVWLGQTFAFIEVSIGFCFPLLFWLNWVKNTSFMQNGIHNIKFRVCQREQLHILRLIMRTPRKINMEPENTPLEKEKHLPSFSGSMLIFGGLNKRNR